MKITTMFQVVIFCFLWVNCNSSSFGGKSRKGSDIKVPTNTNEEKKDDETTDTSCPPEPQSLLIIDLKSGWWSGDGGDYFKAILGSISNPDCTDQMFVEYHHIIKQASFSLSIGGTCEATNLDLSKASAEGITYTYIDGKCEFVKGNPYIDTRILYPEKTDAFYGEATFSSSFMNEAIEASNNNKPLFIKELAQYTQIWILSGSEGDNLDFPVAHAFFEELLSKISSANVPLFIGAGYGSISHANALTSKLGLGTVFTSDIPISGQGDIVDLRVVNEVQNTISIENRVDIPSSQSSHILFNNVSSIADKMLYVVKQRDGIIKDSPTDISIASDKLTGVTTLIGDMIGTATYGEKNVVCDAGLQRFYSVHNDSGADKPTLTYLQNIALFLAQ